MSYVYFIKPLDSDGPVKIGHTYSPVDRLHNLAAWSPVPLELVATIEATLTHERRFHALFLSQHLRKEWFSWSPELADVIERVKAKTFDLDTLPAPIWVHHPEWRFNVIGKRVA